MLQSLHQCGASCSLHKGSLTMKISCIKRLAVPDVSEEFMNSADVLLILHDGVAIPCHSQILSMHSAVLRNMLADLPACQHKELRSIPLADFTEAQCSAVLAHLYVNGVSAEGAAFANHLDAAVDVARFAHTYDVPHALRQAQAYLTSLLDEQSKFFVVGMCRRRKVLCERATGKSFARTVVLWALMADKYDMRRLCAHCERFMVVYWEVFQDHPDLVDQLSSSALQRVAKGLHETLVASVGRRRHAYPSTDDFFAWQDDHGVLRQDGCDSGCDFIWGSDAPGLPDSKC